LSFIVDSFAQPHWLLWRSRARSWAWRLVPLTDGRTRLISRLNTFYDWRRGGTLVTVLLMEFGDYAMMRRMLRGIRERAEAEHQRRAQSMPSAGSQHGTAGSTFRSVISWVVPRWAGQSHMRREAGRSCVMFLVVRVRSI
jgi:hypothetical protein